MDPYLLWANFVASLPVPDRAAFMDGTVPFEQLPQVMAHFAVTHRIHHAGNADDCPRAAGGAIVPEYNPTAAPAYEGQHARAWPTFIAYITNNNDNATYHITLHATSNARAAAAVRTGPFSVIGWQSRLIPGAEISEVVNIPKLVFATVYRRLQGTARNSLGLFPVNGRINQFVLPAVPVVPQLVSYRCTGRDAQEAVDLAADIKVHPSSLNVHDFNAREVASTLDLCAKEMLLNATTGAGLPYRNVNFHLYHGAYGTGKTFALEAALRAAHQAIPFTPATLAFHTWDHDLRKPLRAAMLAAFPGIGLQSGNFMTGAMPLVQPRTGTVVLDDAGKCWNGFIPLMLASNPGITDVYVTFDVAQAVGVFPNSPSISRENQSTADWLSAKSDYYGTQVVRTAAQVTELYGLPPSPPIAGRIIHRGQVIVVSQSPANVPLLAVSPRFVQTQAMGGQTAATFTESQGHTIHGDVCIDLGGLTATTTDRAAWTALTRATGNIYLKMGPMMSSPTHVEAGWSKSQILTALLTVASSQRTPYLTAQVDADGLISSAVLSHLSRCLSPAAAARLGLPAPNPVVGVRPYIAAKYRSSWLATPTSHPDTYTARTHRARITGVRTAPSPAFSRHTAAPPNTHTTVADIVQHLTSVPADSRLSVPATNYRLPAAPALTGNPDPVHEVEEPTDDVLREVTAPNASSTFQHVPDGSPGTLHHTRADRLTDALGMAKRVRVGEHSRRWTPTDARRLSQLQRGFRKFFDVPAWHAEGFNPALLERCTQDKLASWAAKRTKKTLLYSVAKQNLDAPFNMVRLFPKGQYIKKQEKMRKHAFASQTVSDFHLGRIFRDAPYAVYLETQILKYAYDSTYLHCRASPDDVSRWYRRWWSPGVMTGNDYTSWDSGVDHVFIEFDMWLMRLSGFPEAYISRLREDRYTTFSHLGTHMPRQESGDRWTWILNTARNCALTGASLDCPARTPVCVSGDDSVTLGAWRRTTGFVPSQWLMTPKREEGKHMTFCGLIFGGPDVSYDSKVVHWRARFGLQQGRNDADYWRSIRDAICESADKLGASDDRLSSARSCLRRAIQYFDLDPALDLPDPPADDQILSRAAPAWLHTLISPVRFLLFL